MIKYASRAYPSAGARYPLEVYPVILNSSDLLPGVYHYNVKVHGLEKLLSVQLKDEMSDITGQEWVGKASVVFVITAILDRSKIKYGDRSYRFVLLEAGHLAQNLYLLCNLMNLKCCSIGGFVDEKINQTLDLDEQNEFAIYMVAAGKD